MKPPVVSAPVWSELFSAADEFKHLAPWEFMDDDLLFAVEDPAGPEVGFRCILGALGEILALAVYRGDEGLKVHQMIQCDHEGGDWGIDDIFAAQNCLMAEFVDRTELEPADRNVIKSVGQKYRGAKAYPQFRSHLPGNAPWYLTEPEASFLAHCLRCATDFVKRDPKFLDEGDDGQFFTYTRNPTRQLNPVWKNYTPAVVELPVATPPDEIRLRRIKSLKLVEDQAWELDQFYVRGGVINDKDRPYYCQMVAAVDEKSGFLLGMEMVDHTVVQADTPREVFWHQLKSTSIYLANFTLVGGENPLASC